MKVLVQIAVTLTTLLLSAGLASACSCVLAPSPDKAFRAAQVVFTGKVIAIASAKRATAVSPFLETTMGPWEQRVDNVWVVSINIQEKFKGVRDSVIAVVTETDTAACGYPFEVGQSYLIYAYERMNTGKRYARDGLSRNLIQSIDNFNRKLSPIETNLCSRTENIQNAEEEVNLLRRLSKNQIRYVRRRSRNI